MDQNKRTFLAICLCMLIVMFYTQSMSRNKATQSHPASTSSSRAEPSISNLNREKQPESTKTEVAETQQVATHPSQQEIAKGDHTIVETDTAYIAINHLGARPDRFLLKKFKRELGGSEWVSMIETSEKSGLPLGIILDDTSDDFVNYQLVSSFEPQPQNFTVKPGEELTLTFKGTLPKGEVIEKTYRFYGDSYLFDINLNLSTDEIPWLEWSRSIPKEKNNEYLNEKQILVFKQDNKTIRVPALKALEYLQEAGNAFWIAISEKYFMAAILSGSNNPKLSRTWRKENSFSVQIAGDPGKSSYRIFVGPKDYDVLEKHGGNLLRAIDLGTFSFLAHPILILLRFFQSFLHNWGLAIILLTLAIKLAFYPLTKASMASMSAMQEIQPEVQALRERIEDPAQLNQELLALYKRRGVNPMGGCFPILIQIPVFLGLYNALNNAFELRHSPYALWINDLSAPERLEIFGIGIPLMILIMGVSMLIQQWTTPSTMDPSQKKAFLMMPIVFTGMFIIFPMPSGLVLYWLINNVISIIQQMYLRSDKKSSPFKATLIASVGIFAFGYILTLM